MIRTMNKLSRSDLFALERYASERAGFRARVIAHKKIRNVALGPHISLLFEDRLTVQYQVQEMLRIERIYEASGIQQELDAYNPLIPDGSNLKATMLFEFPDPAIRAERLALFAGLEHQIYAEVHGQSRIVADADENLERGGAGRPAAVHFLRFEFPPGAIAALREGAGLSFGVDDPRLSVRAHVAAETRTLLSADFRN
ncbi:MAG: DUF3501 family protein [Arenimonas sp.]